MNDWQIGKIAGFAVIMPATRSQRPETLTMPYASRETRSLPAADRAGVPLLVRSLREISGFSLAWASMLDASRPLKVRLETCIENLRLRPVSQDELVLLVGRPGPPVGSTSCALLSTQERQRALRFRFEADKWSYSAAHSLLRASLATLAGCDPLALEFMSETAGKPIIDPSSAAAEALHGLHFNLSHTRGLVAVALARHPIGIDVERARRVPEMRDLVIELMSENALARFDATRSACEQSALFMRYWTLCEAYLKACGEGLVGTTRHLEFSPSGVPVLFLGNSNRPEQNWQFGFANGEKANWRWADGASQNNLAIATMIAG